MTKKLDNAVALYIEGIRDGNAREAVTKYTGERYTQHSTGVADGIEGFVAFFEPFIERCTDRDIRVVRAIEDGPNVFCHASQSLNGGEARWITTDLFDTDASDRIIEHWDVIGAWAPDSADGRSQVGGPTEVTDLERTPENKERVRRFVEQVLIGGAHTGAGQFVSADLVQHDLQIANGLDAWLGDLARRNVSYQEIFKLIGQGNFVVTYCKVNVGADAHAVFDVFRFADGHTVERWTNAEVVPDDSGNSGKF